MECQIKETITETVEFNQEANHHLPIVENIKNSQEVRTEDVESTSGAVVSANEQHLDDVAVHDPETKTENDDKNHEVIAATNADEIHEINKGDNDGTLELEQQKTVPEVAEVPENCQEYESISEHEGKDGQPTEYESNYVLEENAESVCISVQNTSADSLEQLPTKTDLLDDNQVNDQPDQEDRDDTNVTPIQSEFSESNLISEHPAGDQVDSENWPQLHPVNEVQPEKDDTKYGYENSNIEGNTDAVEEIKDQNVIENEEGKMANVIENDAGQISKVIENEAAEIPKVIGNEAGDISNVTESLDDVSEERNITSEISKDTVSENVEDVEEKLQNDVKQETIYVEGDENNPVENTEQDVDKVNEAEAHAVHDETVENIDESAVPSENITLENEVEDYTIAEGMEVTEIQEGEYTIVEGPSSLDITTNQLEEAVHSEETWVLLENENSEDGQLETVIEDQNEAYMSELRSETESRQSMSSQASENRPRRGRKPTYDIPMHVLGHDISKPMETVPNGRALPKPRLGVKVPYRNLTSQIVTKAEIEKEVMERARLKQEQANARADVIFARKLTQRLARKIAPSPDPLKKVPERRSKSATQIQRKEPGTASEGRKEVENNQDNTKIHNDSDLLAILEGEGDEMPVLPKEIPQTQADDLNLKMLEREIALQQLQDLPHQAPKHRIYKGRQIKADGNAPLLTPEASVSAKSKTSNKSDDTVKESTSSNQKSKNDQPTNVLSDKENETTRQLTSKDTPSISPKRDQTNAETVSSPKKQPIEIEPQVKVNMVLKTYSRKRKTVELSEGLMDSPLPKKPMFEDDDIKIERTDASASPNVYVTKSSRVIKKKVIWDPDETPTRSPKPVTRTDIQPPKTTAVKSTRAVEKAASLEKASEKKTVTDKQLKDKFEKKTNEKVSNKKSAISPEKKIIVTKVDISKSKTPLKSKKIRSEVDKLLMDEGAVKMLYDLKNNDEAVSKKKKDVYSVEKAHKEIMKKANEIKSDLQQNTSNESPKFLRKKESFTPSPLKPAQITYSTERKMSKDSTRSSVHTPPGSPAYSFPHSQSSMLVRRRSSSSISSGGEIDENDGSKTSRKKSLTTSSDGPKLKKIKKSELNEQSENSSGEKGPPEKSALAENEVFPYKSFSVTKKSKHIYIHLNYVDEKCYCTAEVLGELTAALNKFAKEKDCRIVAITSNSKAFCLGLDYTSLISDKEDTRKGNATKLAEKVSEFLLCLLKFPKVLIAGIQGDCAGLGVTMLPLFDMVIASDTATFSTTYASLGCVAEAGFLLSPPISTNHGLAAELLYNTNKLTADDAFRRGLITRLCWPEKYNETLKTVVASVSKGSIQSLMATKQQLRKHLIDTTEAAIKSECKVLVEHWMSRECQKNFAELNANAVE